MIYSALLLGSLSAFVAGEKAQLHIGDCLVVTEPGSGNLETNCLVNGVDVQAMKATLDLLQAQVAGLLPPPPSTPPPTPPPPSFPPPTLPPPSPPPPPPPLPPPPPPPPPFSPPPPSEYYSTRVSMGAVDRGSALPCFDSGSTIYKVERSGYFFISASISFGGASGWGSVSLCVNTECGVCKSYGWTDGNTLVRAGADLACSISLTAADELKFLFDQDNVGGQAKWATVSIAALYHTLERHPVGSNVLPAPFKSSFTGALTRGSFVPNTEYFVPASGRYMVTCNAMHGNGGVFGLLYLVKTSLDGVNTNILEAFGVDSGAPTGGGTDLFGVVELQAGDSIKVQFHHDSGGATMQRSIFSVVPLHFMDQSPLPHYYIRPPGTLVSQRSTYLNIFTDGSTEHTVPTTGKYLVTCNIKMGGATMFGQLDLMDGNGNTLCAGYSYDNGAPDGRAGTDLVCTVRLMANDKIKIYFMHDTPGGRTFSAAATVTQIIDSSELP